MKRYTNSHEWVQKEEEEIVLGITEYAQSELGDIVYVQLPTMGKKIEKEEVIAVLESTKAAVDIYTPVSGEVVEVNALLQEAPDLINMAAESTGWICKIKPFSWEEVNQLLTEKEYKKLIGRPDNTSS